jgi:hypothetical protein
MTPCPATCPGAEQLERMPLMPKVSKMKAMLGLVMVCKRRRYRSWALFGGRVLGVQRDLPVVERHFETIHLA